jgi:ubiquinone/menaquinone biosynthesis C-methylase UbiE
VSGNRPDAVLEHAQIESVRDRVESKEGDARELPFANETFDVAVSNFVVHENEGPQGADTMMREVARVC